MGLDEPWPRMHPNAWLGQALIGGPGSFGRMYQVVDPDLLTDPQVVGIDFPTLTVSQAIYDRAQSALIVSITPGSDNARPGGPTTFRVKNVKDTAKVAVRMDGKDYDGWRVEPNGELRINA